MHVYVTIFPEGRMWARKEDEFALVRLDADGAGSHVLQFNRTNASSIDALIASLQEARRHLVDIGLLPVGVPSDVEMVS